MANLAEEEKNAEEKAEEKKKMDMMRKFYRNRYSSFLQALTEQKAKKEAEEKAVREAAEKKKLKVAQKVLGDGSRIRSKLFEQPGAAKDEVEVQIPANLSNVKDLSATSKSTQGPLPRSKQGRTTVIKR